MGAFSTLALIAAGSAVGAASSIAAGKDQARSAAYQAAVLRQQAQTERAMAAAEEQRMRRNQSKGLSAQAARFSARGIDPSVGSALLSQENAAADAEFDALLARAGGLARAAGLDARAQGSEIAAENARRAGIRGATSALLSGATRISANWPAKKTP